MIPLNELVRGHLYRIEGRNMSYGVWDGEEEFIGLRWKFGRPRLEGETHHDLSQYYGTATPLEDLGHFTDEPWKDGPIIDRKTGRELLYVMEGEKYLGFRFADTPDGPLVQYPEVNQMGTSNEKLYEKLMEFWETKRHE